VKRIPVVPVLIVVAFLVGTALIAVGAALINPPVGLIVAGVATILGAYAAAYITAGGGSRR
jgi:hypothetical protein